mmetsp:Transcript_33864/g.48112  ORF Transcript_33864/g.48112 Transcript_33864/m.48112 type:complete len:99 (-) Transcript_33864:381-677(-)
MERKGNEDDGETLITSLVGFLVLVVPHNLSMVDVLDDCVCLVDTFLVILLSWLSFVLCMLRRTSNQRMNKIICNQSVLAPAEIISHTPFIPPDSLSRP